jgi:uncharacterized protein YcfJ
VGTVVGSRVGTGRGVTVEMAAAVITGGWMKGVEDETTVCEVQAARKSRGRVMVNFLKVRIMYTNLL